MPGSPSRMQAQAAIESLRQAGGVFVDAVRATRMPMALTEPNLPGNPIVFANEAFLKLSGYSMEEVLGQQPHFMNGPGTDPKDAARFTEAIRADQDDIVETVQYRKNGSRFVAAVLISGFKDAESRTLNHFMSWLDVTRRVDAEDEVADLRGLHSALREELRNTQLLHDLGTRLVSEESIQTIYEELLSAAMEIARAEAGTVQALDLEAQELLIIATRGFSQKTTDYFHRVDARSETSCGIALRSGERAYLNFDPSSTDKSARMHVDDGVLSAQSTPLISRTGKPIGMVSTHWAELDHRPSERQLRFLDLLARQAADLLEQRAAAKALRESEEKYRTLFETIDEGFTIMEAVRDHAGRVVDVIYRQANQAWARLFGFEVELGRKASELFSYPPNAPWIETWNRVLETGEPVREEQYVASTNRWYNVRFSRIGSAGSDLIAAVFDDVTEQKRAEAELRESEQRLAAELENAEALQMLSGLLITDGESGSLFEQMLDTAIAIMGADFGSIQLMNADRGELQLIVSRNFSPDAEAYWQTVSAASGSICGLALARGERMIVEDVTADALTRTSDSMRYWKGLGIVAVQSTPLIARNGMIIGMIATHWRKPHRPEERELRLFDVLVRQAADFIERIHAEEALRRSERHAQTLLAELQHRVRNTLTVVRSIARRSAKSTTSAEDMLAHFQGRIDAFSRVQAALTRNAEGTVRLASIIEDEMLAHAAHSGEQLTISGPDISLGSKAAERLSLAIHELTTNAVKHGALINGDGAVRISWAKKRKAAGEELILNWRETGVKLDRGKPAREGFGLGLLLRALPYDLGGATKVEFTPTGLSFQLEMPLI